MYAPKQWMLDKLRGRWAPKPNAGPHKLRECLPLIVMLRQRLKYALTYREVKMIVMQRLIKVDGKVRSDMFYPAGFMDVVQIEKTKENFRLLYNTKGRFMLHKVGMGQFPHGIPFCSHENISVTCYVLLWHYRCTLYISHHLRIFDHHVRSQKKTPQSSATFAISRWRKRRPTTSCAV